MAKGACLLNKEKYVYQTVAELSARLGIPAPEVYFKDTGNIRFRGKSTLGKCYRQEHAIMVRTRGLPLRGVKDTIAHELVHLAFPKLSHGVRFEQYIKALLSGRMVFDGRGLNLAIQKPAASVNDEIHALELRAKKMDAKIKRLTTLRKKLARKINRLSANALM